MSEIEKDQVVGVLNRILEAELAGVVRYTHYSLLVFGFGRIPIVAWLREQAAESLVHAQQAGEWITTLGAYPSLAIGRLLDTHTFDIGAILRESLQAETDALALYRELLSLVEHLQRARRGQGLRLRSVRVQTPSAAAIEVSAHLTQGTASRAAALRISRRRGSWVATHLAIALQPRVVHQAGWISPLPD